MKPFINLSDPAWQAIPALTTTIIKRGWMESFVLVEVSHPKGLPFCWMSSYEEDPITITYWVTDGYWCGQAWLERGCVTETDDGRFLASTDWTYYGEFPLSFKPTHYREVTP